MVLSTQAAQPSFRPVSSIKAKQMREQCDDAESAAADQYLGQVALDGGGRITAAGR
jgi:hypothetical protein